jgi:hypothetical protein
MLNLSVKIGQAVHIGSDDPAHGVVLRVEDKSGRMVRLAISTAMSPIRMIADGLFPPRYTTGITGERRRILEPIDQMRMTG